MKLKDILFIHLQKTHIILFLFGNLSTLINFLMPIFLSRILDITEFGTYKAFFTYVVTIPFLTLASGHLGYLYFKSDKVQENQRDTIKTNFILQVIQSSIVAIMGAVLIASHINVTNIAFSYQFLILLIGVLSIPSTFFSELNIIKGQTLKGASLYLLFDIFKVLCLVLLSYYHSLEYALWAFLVLCIFSFLFSTFLSWWFFFRGGRFVKEEAMGILRYSLPLSLSSILFFGLDKFDQLALLKFLSLGGFALFSVGCFFFPPLLILEGALQKRVIPLLSSFLRQENRENVEEVLQWYMDRLSLLIIPVSIFSYFYQFEIITFLFGKTYALAAQYFGIYVLSYLIYLVPNDLLQKSTGKNHDVLKINMIVFGLYSVCLLGVLFLTNGAIDLRWFIGMSLSFRLVARSLCFVKGALEDKLRISSMVPYRSLLTYALLSFLALGAIQLLNTLDEIHFIAQGVIFSFLVWGVSFLILRNQGKKYS